MNDFVEKHKRLTEACNSVAGIEKVKNTNNFTLYKYDSVTKSFIEIPKKVISL